MFKDKIKKLREAHNLTQEELAKKITVSRTAVSKWETSELISDTDIGDKRRLDRQKRQESIIRIFFNSSYSFTGIRMVLFQKNRSHALYRR